MDLKKVLQGYGFVKVSGREDLVTIDKDGLNEMFLKLMKQPE